MHAYGRKLPCLRAAIEYPRSTDVDSVKITHKPPFNPPPSASESAGTRSEMYLPHGVSIKSLNLSSVHLASAYVEAPLAAVTERMSVRHSSSHTCPQGTPRNLSAQP